MYVQKLRVCFLYSQRQLIPHLHYIVFVTLKSFLINKEDFGASNLIRMMEIWQQFNIADLYRRLRSVHRMNRILVMLPIYLKINLKFY
jgi:hypothetical protein